MRAVFVLVNVALPNWCARHTLDINRGLTQMNTKDMLVQNRLDSQSGVVDNGVVTQAVARTGLHARGIASLVVHDREDNTLDTESRAAQLLKTMIFAAAR